MKIYHSPESLEFALKEVSKILFKYNIEHFIHGGILLGYARQGKPIVDDDIDIVLHNKYWKKINKIFRDTLKWPVHENYKSTFIAFTSPFNDVQIDFYFYYDEGDFIREKWNYFGSPHDPILHILIPKNILFPLNIVDGISFPFSPEECSRYTYGDRWKRPMGRNDYTVKIINNTPEITYLKEEVKDL
jgi:hypothetical protein